MLRNSKLSCEVLINLANNVLDAAKLRSDKMDISYSSVDLTTTVKKMFLINSEVLKLKKIQVKAFVDERLPDSVWTDGSRMLQIMMNLMSNALKFTPIAGKVIIRLSWCPPDMNTQDLLEPMEIEDLDQSSTSPISNGLQKLNESIWGV